VALYALFFAGAIEFVQTFLPAHTAGITDMIMAALEHGPEPTSAPPLNPPG